MLLVWNHDEICADVVCQAKGVVKKVEGAITGNAAKKVRCLECSIYVRHVCGV